MLQNLQDSYKTLFNILIFNAIFLSVNFVKSSLCNLMSWCLSCIFDYLNYRSTFKKETRLLLPGYTS